jgi:hypothetical protein
VNGSCGCKPGAGNLLDVHVELLRVHGRGDGGLKPPGRFKKETIRGCKIGRR